MHMNQEQHFEPDEANQMDELDQDEIQAIIESISSGKAQSFKKL